MSEKPVSGEPPRPLLRIVRGVPDDVELAALTVVLAAAAGGSAEPPAVSAPSPWSDPAARLRAALQPSPGAWRATYRPR